MIDMNASEFRIGNWVNYRCPTTGEEKEMQAHWTTLKSLSSGINHKYKRAFSPIKLTIPWLKKLGFKKVESRYSGSGWTRTMNGVVFDIADVHKYQKDVGLKPKGSRFRVILYKASGNDYTGPVCDIPFVHNLQNIYHSLAGKEL